MYGQTQQRNEHPKLEQNGLCEAPLPIPEGLYQLNQGQGRPNHPDGRANHAAQLEAKTSADLVITQKREINRLQSTVDGLTNQVAEYRSAVESLQGKLKEAYGGIQSKNEAMKELVAQRDEFVKKLNDSVKERNDVRREVQ